MGTFYALLFVVFSTREPQNTAVSLRDVISRDGSETEVNL